MRDWVNAQRRAGLMTIEESDPLIFMTFRAIIVGGQLIDVGATDPTRYNFIKHLENGIPFAAARNDESALKQLHSGIETMLRNQDKTYSFERFV